MRSMFKKIMFTVLILGSAALFFTVAIKTTEAINPN